MLFFELFCYAILVLYILLIIGFGYGFLRIPKFSIKQTAFKNPEKISVIIPFKNEEKHLKRVFLSLKKQTLNKAFYEIVFVDDHSSDASNSLLSKLTENESQFRLLALPPERSGKKQALETGIANAANNLLVMSDADCYHSEKWLETIFCYYNAHKAKIIIAPVLFTGSENFFANIQKLEFLSLAASTAGAAGIGHSIMNNGANTIFEKPVFYEFSDAMNKAELSGDDVFLLHSIKKKYPHSVHYLKSKEAVVYTDASSSLHAFLKQRIRWASKSKSYTDLDAVFVSLLVFSINFLLLVLLSASLLNSRFLSLLFIVFAGKAFTDIAFLAITASFFKQLKYLLYFPLLSLLYPFYIVYTAISGLVRANIQWK